MVKNVDKLADPMVGMAIYDVAGYDNARRTFKLSKYVQPTFAVLLGKKSDGSFAPVNIDSSGNMYITS